ncbi:hypothetical protein G4B88_008493 [Cannabis sativa]|uniref:Ubiquitin-like protease family profile domain-containing protein n=1 Tax=Cannabis sativa TaxID=3483 RepID=A0A7J6DVH2_CANSA|nr:hypothetical protein G4B88_008493 [Cannabis sativa]
MDVMNTLFHLKLRNITPTSVERSEQSQVVDENIDVDATIASAVKAVENLIGSSTNVSTSVETSEKNDLEMHIDIIFYYLRKKIIITSLYEKFVEKNNDISVLSLSHNVAQYIRGDFKGLCNESKFSTMEPFPIVAVDGLPKQVTADCGVFVASFAEYFIDGKPIPSSGFDVEIHRDHLAVLFDQYGMKKQLENIETVAKLREYVMAEEEAKRVEPRLPENPSPVAAEQVKKEEAKEEEEEVKNSKDVCASDEKNLSLVPLEKPLPAPKIVQKNLLLHIIISMEVSTTSG